MVALPRIRLGVIDDARRRQRRRRLASSLGVLVALATVLVVIHQPARDRPAPTAGPPRHLPFVPPGRLLAREPYMGVACRVPNSTRCDRVGLAIWLKRPAAGVRAEIHGRSFSLERQAWNPKPEFDGYLRGAGLQRVYGLPGRWLGAKPAVHPQVRLLIDYGHGRIVETRLRVWLTAGWG